MGGNALTQVLKGEQRYNLTLRYLPQYRNTQEAIDNIRLLSPSGERVSLAQLCTSRRKPTRARRSIAKDNQRYVAIKYSVRERDSGRRGGRGHSRKSIRRSSCRGAITSIGKANTRAKCAQKRACWSSFPITVLLIFIILYSMYKSFKWAILILCHGGDGPHRRIAGAAGHAAPTSASRRRVGFLALFGVSVQTGVIMLEYINQLRARGLLD